MSVRVIFNHIFHRISNLSGALCSLLVLTLAGLTFLNHQLSFNIPASNRIRDAFDASTPFTEVKKLDARELKTEIASNFVSSVPASSYYYASYSAPAPSVYYTAGFHINEPDIVGSPDVDAQYGVKRYVNQKFGYNGKFLYAHSSLAFSPLKSLSVGSTFIATIDGVTTTYRVSARYVFNKASQLDGGGANNSRRDRIYRAKDENGVAHSLSLMTCGNGSNDDSNWRLVLFADAV